MVRPLALAEEEDDLLPVGFEDWPVFSGMEDERVFIGTEEVEDKQVLTGFK
ncbi:MAG: hypothetical protein LQ341_000295 [Variospora aurantia]|nr:MAG: hypothetical protein LQ341_000295 [Variospora aurantia]